MILVYIFLILILFILLIVFSNLQIEICNFKADKIHHINKNYLIKISLKLFDRIKWINLRFNNEKLKKMHIKEYLEKLDIKQIEKDINLAEIKEIITIKFKIQRLNLKINLGLEDIMLTTYLIPVICTILSILLVKKAEKEAYPENLNYEINPIYNKGNTYSLSLNTIVNFKITDIIKTIYRVYKINKKTKKEKEKIDKKTEKKQKIKMGFNYSV